jgi:hypothetical protein
VTANESGGPRRAGESGGWGEPIALGLMFPAAVVAGYLLGRVVGRWLGLPDWAPIAGAALGVLGAFARLLRWASSSR